MVRRIFLVGMASSCLWASLLPNSAEAQGPWMVSPDIEVHRFGQERSNELGALRVPRIAANFVLAYFPDVPFEENYDLGVSARLQVPIGSVLEVQGQVAAFGIEDNSPIATEVSGAVAARLSIHSQHTFAFSAEGGATFAGGSDLPLIGAGIEYRFQRVFQYTVGIQYRMFPGDYAINTSHLLFTIGGNFPIWSLR